MVLHEGCHVGYCTLLVWLCFSTVVVGDHEDSFQQAKSLQGKKDFVISALDEAQLPNGGHWRIALAQMFHECISSHSACKRHNAG